MDLDALRRDVDAVLDVPTSSVALAVNTVCREKNKVMLNSGAATTDLTGAPLSDDDLALYERAQTLAGGNLSAAVSRALRRFVDLPPSPLERREKLEQLRALEAGMSQAV